MAGLPPQPKRSFPPRLRPDEAFGVLAVLLVAAFVMGGGSRHDIESLPYLRTLACIAGAIGVLGLGRENLRAYWAPFALLGALALVMAMQLIPLPPSLWTGLPARAAIVELDSAVGLVGQWRPLTLSPMKTANALASLALPFAVLVLYCQLGERRQRQILVLIVALAATSAVTGILQLLAGSGSGLYLYDVTHEANAVGLFANRNHHSAFLAAAMLVGLDLAVERGRLGRDVVSIACLAAVVLLFAGILGNVSRGGLLCGAVALVYAPMILRVGAGGKGAALVGALFALPVLGVAMLFAFTQRSPVINRLLADDQLEGMRGQVLPTLLAMARDFQPWGAGFGSFEYAYRMREPTELMLPRYFNNAHNDWLQFVIEGGAAATLLLAAGVALVAWKMIRIMQRNVSIGNAMQAHAWLGFGILLVLGFASLLDYPLRVPSIMAVAIIALALVNGSGFGAKTAD
jgi:O-antigen ligase